MENMESIVNLVLDNIKKLFFPEDWIDIDMKLSKTELFVLLMVHRKGELTMSMLASEINSPMSTATGIADRLVKNGYLERGNCESDRRIVVVRLTKKGSSLVERLKTLIFEYIGFISENLDAEEKSLLLRVFFKIIKLLGQGVQNKNTKDDVKEKIEKIDIQ